MLHYTETIRFLVKHLKVEPKDCLNWICFIFYYLFLHGTLYRCVRYLNVEYQDEIFKHIIKCTTQKVITNLVLDVDVMCWT